MAKKEIGERRSKRQGMDLGRVLLWSAVLVEAPRWAGAMLAADVSEILPGLSVALNIANTMAGAFMGILVVVATAYLLDALRKTRPTVTARRTVKSKNGKKSKRTTQKLNWRFLGLAGFAFGLLALTPFVLGPYVVSRMTGESIATVLNLPFWRFTWAVMVVIAPAFVIGGVAFAQPGLVTIGGNQPGNSRSTGDKARSASGKSPASEQGEREASGEKELVYQNFGELPESEYPWIVEATTRAIVRKYQMDGADPGRKARDWKSRAEKALGNGHTLQQKLPMDGGEG